MERVRILLAAHGEAETTGLLEQFQVSWRTLSHAAHVMNLSAPLRFMICSLAALRKRLKGGNGSKHNHNTRQQVEALQAKLNQASKLQFHVEPAFASAVPRLSPQLKLPDDFRRQLVFSMIPSDSRLSCGLICHQLCALSDSSCDQTTVLARLWDSPELIKVHCQHVAEHYPEDYGRESCLVLLLHGTLVRDQHGKAPAFHTGMTEKAAYAEALCTALWAMPERPWSRIELAYLNHGVGGQWSKPTLAKRMEQLASEGVERVVVYACEHLVDGGETAGLPDELEASSVKHTKLLPCLNSFPPFIDFLAQRALDALYAGNTNQCCDACPLTETSG